jgi:putative lipoic acid-binding regulatory protein
MSQTEERKTLLEFPCEFPIKIMGHNDDSVTTAVLEVVLTHAPDFDPQTIEVRPSSKGNYMSITCTLRATSQKQLDDLYRALSSHPLVKVVL